MTRFQATAPGKIILFGEHAVVYGHPAIAVPVAKVRALAALELTGQKSGFRIIAPDIKRDYRLAEAEVDDPIAAIIRMTLTRLKRPVPDQVCLTISSTIPLASGLGSGAAISTAIVRALAGFSKQTLATAEVADLVYQAEKLYHGTPSGIDNTVVSYEQPVFFIKGRPIQRIKVSQPFDIIIGDTGIVAATRVVVDDVRRRWQANPELHEGYFDEVGAIANQARVEIEHGQAGLPALGKLMNENQSVLVSLGVSSPELGQLIGAARQAGALGAKLSGAGWGGNMIALPPPDPAGVEAVAAALTKAGASGVIVTRIC